MTIETAKTGDRVWVVAGQGNRATRKIKRVVRVTPHQLFLDDKNHYRKATGKRVGYGAVRITRIATTEECAEYDAQVARETAEAEHHRREQSARDAKRAELNGLFDNPNIFVNASPDDERGQWEVTLYGSEASVRRLAAMLAAARVEVF